MPRPKSRKRRKSRGLCTPKSAEICGKSGVRTAERVLPYTIKLRFVKKIYILGPQPMYGLSFLNRFLHLITSKPDELESLHLDKKRTDIGIKHARKRFVLLQNTCRKCRVFEVSHVLLDANKYLTFDRDSMLAYVDNTVHFTAPAIRKFEPVFEEIVKDVMHSL
ncbi:unnamed protein product [Caenorhabditis sp. 36 PRJEB53466]|nr:unnamed protein product [Caenorhabditis sp. 36 PRJEB53466]